MHSVTEGRLSTGVPFMRLGEGPPLVVASGLTPSHANPTGVARRAALRWAAPFAEHFTVHLLNRRVGIAPGSTMADLAADYAGAIERDIGQPVKLHGTSTGGSVALQLAIDRPELVERMVVAAAACRLGEHGRRLQAELARLAEARDARGASALLMQELARGPLRYPARGIGWLMGGAFATDDPSDMVRTIAAEDLFDVEPQLGRIQAPTLVLGGTADTFYSEELFRRTAAGIPGGRPVLFPGRSHMFVAGSQVSAATALGFLVGG
jgi:pimeloyl-ACP methyl ester carboxylesterase